MNESPMGERELDTAPTSSPKLWPAEADAEARPVSARSPKAREENVARHMPQAGFLERQMRHPVRMPVIFYNRFYINTENIYIIYK